MTEEDSETKFKPRIGEPPLRVNKNSTVLRAERKSKEKDNKGSKPTITAARIEKAQNTQANYNDDKPIKEKTSIFRHLLFGFMIAFCIALVTNSIRNDFHLITLNFIFNFERDLVYGYLMRLSAVIGSALAYLIIGSVALLFRIPTLFYIIICLTGFFGIYGSI